MAFVDLDDLTQMAKIPVNLPPPLPMGGSKPHLVLLMVHVNKTQALHPLPQAFLFAYLPFPNSLFNPHLILNNFHILGPPYIIGNLSKRRCQKWAHMSHLDICSTSYGKKKSWESNWQFDSRPLKVGN
jgi:hypothetical protein